jgi:general secretion pathway protein I
MAALAVFAIAAMALLHLSGENARAASIAREHAFASLVAENLMVEAVVLRDAAVSGAGRTQMDGRDWDWTRAILPSGEPGMLRVTVSVSPAGERRAAATLIGFRTGEPGAGE